MPGTTSTSPSTSGAELRSDGLGNNNVHCDTKSVFCVSSTPCKRSTRRRPSPSSTSSVVALVGPGNAGGVFLSFPRKATLVIENVMNTGSLQCFHHVSNDPSDPM